VHIEVVRQVGVRTAEREEQINHGSLTEGGRSSTIDPLVLTRFHHLLFLLKIIFAYAKKQATLMRKSTEVSLPL
jgi:hypothetical protein